MQSAEIIAVGSELLTPDKTDTNSLWLTGKLNEIGIEVKLKIVVGDDEGRLEETMREAMQRSDIVISTGGLGPTEDDITRPCAARAVGRELVYHQALTDRLVERFRSWGREMPEINKRQAYVIDGAEILDNPNGSASGMMLETDSRLFVILPGPPRENQPMFENLVLPRLKKESGEIRVRRRILRVAGMGESAVDEAVAPIYKLYENPQTTILFNRSEVEINLTATGKDEMAAEQLLDEVSGKITEELGTAVFSQNGETMEEIIGLLLSEQGKTLAIAESCTGGLIAQRITDVAGSSRYFLEGSVTYANEAKTRTLGVLTEMLETYGAVSKEVAEAMAHGMQERTGADFAISVTGIAGPGGGTTEKPVGLVYIGYADGNEVSSKRLVIPGDRYLIRWRTSQAALDYLRRKIIR
jgi:nicotinamide-nucleotide amidase